MPAFFFASSPDNTRHSRSVNIFDEIPDNFSMKTLLLFLSLCSTLAAALDPAVISPQEITAWEKIALKEVKKHKKSDPEKEFQLYMVAGRELAAHGLHEKARQYYLLAFNHASKSDKSEAVMQLANLNRGNKDELRRAVERAKTWFTKHPEHAQDQAQKWLAMMDGYAQGKTPLQENTYAGVWARDARVGELMKEGKAQEAYQLLGPRTLTEANINDKIRQDLLASVALGKSAAPPLWCKSTMDRYPTSLTWSMRFCRYLDDWKTGKKSRESVQSVREQLKKENPERLHWADLLERL